MQLNPDQKKSLKYIQSWWFSDKPYCILDGKGGTGKTHLVDKVLELLTDAEPLIIAPTHEALKQVKDKITNKDRCIFRTAHAALGAAPTDDEEELKFEQIALPKLWDDINLAVADEASMYCEKILDLLLQTGTKILFVGHSSQLPPPKKKRSVFDKCISPVFTKGFPTTTLTIPQRNMGKLWDFNNTLEGQIYIEGNVQPPTDFDINKREVTNFIYVSGKDRLFSGESKIILWSNGGVDRLNNMVRDSLFNTQAVNPYIEGDKIILTKPCTVIESLDKHTSLSLTRLMRIKDDLKYLYSNSKAVVKSYEVSIVKLATRLSVPVYMITVDCEGEEVVLYELVVKDDLERIKTFYTHIAWGESNKAKKAQAFKARNFILSCFAEVKYFYAATAHRMQGSTIKSGLVINSDIEKNSNAVERKKCRYVACSRFSEEMGFYRGLL